MARNKTTFTKGNNIVAIKMTTNSIFDIEEDILNPLKASTLHKLGAICVREIREVIKNGDFSQTPYDTGVLWSSIHYVVGGDTDRYSEMNPEDNGDMVVWQKEYPAIRSGKRMNIYNGTSLPRLTAKKDSMRVGSTLPYAYEVEFGRGANEKYGARPFVKLGVERAISQFSNNDAMDIASTMRHTVR